MKLSYFFDKRVKPHELEGLQEMKNDMRNKQEFKRNFGSTPAEKKQNLIRWKDLAKRHNTPVK